MERVSVLYREPKLLKERRIAYRLQRLTRVSVLYREPKLLKAFLSVFTRNTSPTVSVLYREPKLLKVCDFLCTVWNRIECFSALP